jgi:hypothetical protein
MKNIVREPGRAGLDRSCTVIAIDFEAGRVLSVKTKRVRTRSALGSTQKGSRRRIVTGNPRLMVLREYEWPRAQHEAPDAA